MSRERVFAIAILLIAVAEPVVIGHQAARTTARTYERKVDAVVRDIAPQTENHPAPIFSCSRAGGGVIVSLGGDGKSVYVYCD